MSLFEEGDLIYSYTRAQAIEDGFLVDLSDNDVIRGHWKYPFACTVAVWGAIEEALQDGHSDLNGILHDISVLAKYAIRQPGSNKTGRVQFTVRIGRAYKRLDLHIGPGDTAEPVLTLMYPHED